MANPQILSGVKVVELGDFVAAPYCGKLLADMGAEVMKIEKPGGGDSSRQRVPFVNDEPDIEKSILFLYLNCNKLSATINLDSERGKPIFKELVSQCDILIEDQPPEQLPKMGLGYEELHRVNQQLVMVSISPFGQSGPYSNYKANYLTAFHSGGEGYCLPGGLGWQLYPEREPIKAGGYMGEYDVGVMAAIIAIAALYAKELVNLALGCHIDVSKQEVLLNLMRNELSRYNEGWVESRATRSLPVGGLMYCRDGFVQLHPHETRMWQALIELMGRPEWAKDSKYDITRLMASLLHASPQEEEELARAQQEANEFIQNWLLESSKTKEEIYYETQARGCACGVVSTPADAVRAKQLRSRGFYVTAEHPEIGQFDCPGAPFIFPRTPWRLKSLAPCLGQHNEEVYVGRLGYSKEELAKLRQGGII